MSHSKGLTKKKKKKIMHNFKLRTSPTYLFTYVNKCLIWPTHDLGRPMHLLT
jgi:hypothetical protein